MAERSPQLAAVNKTTSSNESATVTSLTCSRRYSMNVTPATAVVPVAYLASWSIRFLTMRCIVRTRGAK